MRNKRIEGKSQINILQRKTLKKATPSSNKGPPEKHAHTNMKTITYYFKTSKRTKIAIEE